MFGLLVLLLQAGTPNGCVELISGCAVAHQPRFKPGDGRVGNGRLGKERGMVGDRSWAARECSKTLI